MSEVRASTQINNTNLSGDGHFLLADGSIDLRGNLNAGANDITNVQNLTINTNPTSDSDVATKGYVDGVAEGLSVKDSVRVRSQSNYDLTNASLGTDTNPNPNNSQIDSAWLNRNDRVLLANQTTGSENGIYVVPDLRAEFELDSGTAGNELRVNLDSNSDIHTEIKLTDPGASNADETVNTTTGGQSTPHQIEVVYAHDGTNITSTVQNIADAINNDSTASSWVTASVLQSSGTVVDNTTGGSYVNMAVFNSGSNANLNRSQDFDSDSNVETGAFAFVEEGTNSDAGYVMTSDNVTVGTDSIGFTKFSGAGSITAGDGLTKSGDTINFNAADNSLTVNTDDAQVNPAPSLTVDPGGNTGLGINPIASGDIYVGQGTGTAISGQTVGGDVTMNSSATFTVQTSGANGLITSTGSGIQIAQLAAGNLILGQGTGTDAASVALGNEAGALDASGNFTLNWAREDLSGSTDGSTTTFSLDGTTYGQAVGGKELVFLNGVLQRPDGDQDPSTITNDYALDTTNNDVVFATAPASGDELLVLYIYT